MAYRRKTRDVWQVQGWYSKQYGWEEVTEESTQRAARERLKEYRANEQGTPFRMVKRRERIAPSAQEGNTHA